MYASSCISFNPPPFKDVPMSRSHLAGLGVQHCQGKATEQQPTGLVAVLPLSWGASIIRHEGLYIYVNLHVYICVSVSVYIYMW